MSPPYKPKAAHRKHGETMEEAFPWILERVRSGIPIRHAEALAGFARGQLYHWCDLHEGAREALAVAKAEGEELLVKGLFDAANEDPKFGLLLLERRRPEEWGKIERVEHSGGLALRVPTRSEALAELGEAAKTDPSVRERLLEMLK